MKLNLPRKFSHGKCVATVPLFCETSDKEFSYVLRGEPDLVHDERGDVPIGCSDRHLELENSGELGRGKKFTKPVGGRKKIGEGGGGGERDLFFLPPTPPPPTFSPQSSSSLQQIQNGGLTLER